MRFFHLKQTNQKLRIPFVFGCSSNVPVVPGYTEMQFSFAEQRLHH